MIVTTSTSLLVPFPHAVHVSSELTRLQGVQGVPGVLQGLYLQGVQGVQGAQFCNGMGSTLCKELGVLKANVQLEVLQLQP